ncbi:hypothetical protein [Elizabethkingia ursingii]
MASKTELKKYFKNGDVPNQEQFWTWIDSYWHKYEYINSKQILYTNVTPTTRQIGDIKLGTTFYKKSVFEILDMMLYNTKISPSNTFNLEITSIPADAIIVMNDKVTNNLDAIEGTNIFFTVSMPGYATYEGRALMDREMSLLVTLVEE